MRKLNLLLDVEFKLSLLLSFFMGFLLPEDLLSENLSSLPLVLCHVAAVKRLPAHHHCADYIFSGPLGSF